MSDMQNKNQEKDISEPMSPRRSSPSAARNHRDIGAQLSAVLPRGVSVLEIASGTGEHGLHLCRLRPDIQWQPSDPNPVSRDSQDAWATEAGGRMLPSIAVDTTEVDWAVALPRYDAIFCANMIHIAPWAAALGLSAAARELIKPDGQMVLYGPFKTGTSTAPSNLDFDASLKSRDSRWGVRDLASVKHIFAKAGFNHAVQTTMPANNMMLVFSRSAP